MNQQNQRKHNNLPQSMNNFALLWLTDLSIRYVGTRDELQNLVKDAHPTPVLALKYYRYSGHWAVMDINVW